MIVSERTPAPSFTAAHDLKARAQAVAAVAAEHSNAVDREARFPAETFVAARKHRLLSMLVPKELGGDGANVSDAVDVCYMLGMGCGSSAMIFAMHQIQVVILLRHAANSSWHQQLLRRLCAEQLLFASSTTENQTGGVVRASSCAVERDGDRMSLVKNGTVMSYGAEADGILLTARRAPDAQPSDQVLVGFVKGDYELEKIKEWDTMGMRGTCSAGYTLMNTHADGGIVSSATTPSAPATNGSNTLAYTPRSSFTAWSTWRLPHHLTLGAGARYSGEMQRGHDGAIGTPAFTDAYWVFDGMAHVAATQRLQSVRQELRGRNQQERLPLHARRAALGHADAEYSLLTATTFLGATNHAAICNQCARHGCRCCSRFGDREAQLFLGCCACIAATHVVARVHLDLPQHRNYPDGHITVTRHLLAGTCCAAAVPHFSRTSQGRHGFLVCARYVMSDHRGVLLWYCLGSWAHWRSPVAQQP